MYTQHNIADTSSDYWVEDYSDPAYWATHANETMVYYVLQFVAGVSAGVVFFVNFLIVFLFCALDSKKRRSSASKVFLCQAFNDVLVAVMLAMATVDYFHWAKPEPSKYEDFLIAWNKAIDFVYYYHVSSSISILFLGSMLAVRRGDMSGSALSLLVVVCYLVSFIPPAVQFLYVQPNQLLWKFHVGLLLFILLLVTSVGIFLFMAFSSIKRRRSADEKQRIRSVKIFIKLCGVYSLTFLPHTVIWITYLGYREHTFIDLSVDKATFLLYCCSAVVNPVIVVCGDVDYKRAFYRLFGMDVSDTDSTTESIEEITTNVRAESNPPTVYTLSSVV